MVDATAAGGIFTDREEDEAPAPQDDGPSWYEQALEAALGFTDPEDGRTLYVQAAQAARDGLCTPRQANHIQNRITQRARLLKTATPVDAEDLAKASGAAPDPTQPAAPAATSTGTDSSTAAAAAGPSEPPGSPEDQPGSVSAAQLTKLHTVLTGLGFGGDDREQKLVIAEVITGHDPLTGPEEGRTSKNLSLSEARKLIDTLDGFADRDALIAHMAERKQAGDGND